MIVIFPSQCYTFFHNLYGGSFFMTIVQTVNAFLGRHGFAYGGPDINTIIDGLLWDMQKGLNDGIGSKDTMEATEDMIPTWSLPPSSSPINKTVMVIDAGGTNFRSCLVHFDAQGKPTITDLEKCAMPGIEKELSKKDFFSAIAKNVDHLKNKADCIGFCFSYPMKITPEGDGQVLGFSKEIKAKEVVGSLVGESLCDVLAERGWNRPKKVVLLNDTSAALLAGATNASGGRKYSSYVGLILGTGMNAAYIESGEIQKIQGMTGLKKGIPESQIVVCETGKFNKLPRSTFDSEFDKTANTPSLYVMEKMCSGAYLGPVSLIALKKAAEDGLFSESVAKEITQLKKFELRDMDQFFYGPYNTETLLGAIMAKGCQNDYDIAYTLLDAFVERSARITSSIIAASVIKSGKGTQASLPVCILCEGTTFYKTHNLQQRLIGYLNTVLTEQRKLYFEIVSLDNAITLGAAVAALS